MVYPLSREHKLLTQAMLKEQGIDKTLEELEAERQEGFERVRRYLIKIGEPVPSSDRALFRLMVKRNWFERPPHGM